MGAAIGDIVGAAVEAESPEYIASKFHSVDEILATESIPEFAGPSWRVGRFTDDTQMMLGVAEWLLEDHSHSPEKLLERFANTFEPWRRYGSGTEAILRQFPDHRDQWQALSTAMFPYGSYGNGSAMRVAPIGLVFANDMKKAAEVAIASSRPTHSHPLAYQGAVLQTIAVATAATSAEFLSQNFISPMRTALTRFSDLLQDTSPFVQALDAIENGLGKATSCREMSSILGTGVTAQEAVPMAIYCFLRHPESFEQVIHEAVFIGGDTDTVACMAGAISGAFLGVDVIPPRSLSQIKEERYSASAIRNLADDLFDEYAD